MAAIIPKIRAGNKFTYLWAIERAGVAVDLTTATDIELSYGVGKPCTDYSKIPFTVVDTNKISSSHLYGVTGTYNLKLEFKIDGEQSTIDIDAFKIVPRSEDASDSSQFAVTSDMAIGFKGDKLTFADLTPSDIAELQQPANDAIASIQAVEVSVEQAEAIRVQAEIDRQTNTGTAIQNAQTAIQNAQTATTNAQTATTNANNAATLANTKAGLADTAATNANNVANGYAAELALKELKSNKQNSLATDGTGVKFPTVDAVNAGLGSSGIRALFVARGAVYNSSTGYYELNGLTDITETQMMDIYNTTSQNIRNSNTSEAFMQSNIRTNYTPGHRQGDIMPVNATGAFFQCANLEVYSANQLLEYGGYMFYGCVKLKTVNFIVLASATATNYTNMFYNCILLENCFLSEIKCNLSFAWSPLLSLASLQSLIQYRANGTTPITITVHPTVFAKLTDNVNYPDWYAVNQDALTKYITFASA